MPKVIFATGFSPNYEPAKKCIPTIVDYCSRHNYELVIDSYSIEGQEASWLKLETLQRVLDKCDNADIVYWVDADCYVVNPAYDAFAVFNDLPRNKDVAFSVDKQGICCGFFAVRGETGRALIDTTIMVGHLTDHASKEFSQYKMEQNTVKHIINSSTRFSACYNHIPARIVSNVECPIPIRKVSWIYHQWGNVGWQEAPFGPLAHPPRPVSIC